jgi:hypothetical protein
MVKKFEGVHVGGPAAVEIDEVLELEEDAAELEGGEEVVVEVKTSISSIVVIRVVGL